MTYQDGPQGRRREPPGEGPTQRRQPGDYPARMQRDSQGDWERPTPPWEEPQRPQPGPDETAVIQVVVAGQAQQEVTEGGGTQVPIYLRPSIEPQPTSFTARILGIYGMGLTLHVVFSFLIGLERVRQDEMWRYTTLLLLTELLLVSMGVFVDRPKSVWAQRWLTATFILTLMECFFIGSYAYVYLH